MFLKLCCLSSKCSLVVEVAANVEIIEVAEIEFIEVDSGS